MSQGLSDSTSERISALMCQGEKLRQWLELTRPDPSGPAIPHFEDSRQKIASTFQTLSQQLKNMVVSKLVYTYVVHCLFNVY